MRAAPALALCVFLPACSFVDDFSRFHTDAGAADLGGLDAGDGGDAGHDLTPAEFTTAFAAGLCAHAVYCEEKLGLGALLEIFCNPAVAGHFFGAAAAGMLPPGVTYDPATAQACLDALAMGDPHDCSVTQTPLPAVCRRVVTGTIATGGRCTFDAECASGSCTNVTSCGGTCDMGGTLTMGAACARNSQCTSALRCRATQCQPPGAVGQPCDEDADCVALTWCEPTSHTCRALPDVGQPCDTSLGGDPCRGLQVCTGPFGGMACADGAVVDAACDFTHPCQPGLRCSDTTHACKTLSGPGGPCTSKENCPFGFYCPSSTCRPLPGIGEACTPIAPCVIGTCVSGTCATGNSGDPCDGSTSLAATCAGYCDSLSMTCHAALAAGATCTTDEQCGPGASCPTGSLRSCTLCPP